MICEKSECDEEYGLKMLRFLLEMGLDVGLVDRAGFEPATFRSLDHLLGLQTGRSSA